MTKQQKTYLLLIAVLVIWGMIGHQIYVRLNPPTPKFKTNQLQTRFQRQQTVEQTFYELSPVYRDPFLGGFPKNNMNQKTVKIIKNTTKPFPNVQYNGMIEGNNHKSYILTVDGKQEIIKKGDVFQGVKLLKATKTAVKVRFEKEIITIVKQ